MFLRIRAMRVLTLASAFGLPASAMAAPASQLGQLETVPSTSASPAAAPASRPSSAARPATVATPAKPAASTAAQPAATPAPPVVVPVPITLMQWNVADAQALLSYIEGIDEEGLIPADYKPDELRAAIEAGPGPALDEAASRSFTWLAEDLRDGRTPMTSRVQWFAVDPDQDNNPTSAIMTKALQTHDVAGTLTGLDPTYPDYQVLKDALAATPSTAKARRALIQINMDRWRWLPRELGLIYLITNVPEFELRLATNQRIVRTYRTIVGKPGKTATPQLAEKVEAVVFNPTWTVPQSIVQGEGLGARLLRRPSPEYKVTKSADGTINVVQQPGPTNSLGLMKIDMPNPHAIYLHDTPNRNLFNAPAPRAFSHGCVRTENAQMLGMTMAMMGAGLTVDQAVAYANSGKYTKVPMTTTFPVYITYFTMAQDITGKLSSFNDIYGRDAPVLASFARPRELKTTQRKSNEAIIKLDNPL